MEKLIEFAVMQASNIVERDMIKFIWKESSSFCIGDNMSINWELDQPEFRQMHTTEAFSEECSSRQYQDHQ